MKTKSSKSEKHFCIYLGPTIISLINHGTIYKGTKEEVLKTLSYELEKQPLIASLIVPDETLVEDLQKVKQPGNLLYVNYRKIVKSKEDK